MYKLDIEYTSRARCILGKYQFAPKWLLGTLKKVIGASTRRIILFQNTQKHNSFECISHLTFALLCGNNKNVTKEK